MTDSRLEKLQRLARNKPEDPFPLYGVAMEHKRLGNLDQAIRSFQGLVSQFPDYTPAYYHCASSLVASGREEEACSVLQAGIETAQRNGDAHARDELQALLDEVD